MANWKVRSLRGLLGAASLLAACSLFIEQEIKNVRCQDTGRIGPPACDTGQICGQGRCHVCETRELCGDGFDNDCNGVTEEGCGMVTPPATGGAGGEDGRPQGGDGGAAASSGMHEGGSSSGGRTSSRDPFP